VLEKSPLEVVHDRIIKEANRKLAYTRWPIAEISERLGFNDLGYFSRFYRQKTGETPTDYRARIRSRMGAHASSAPAPQKATA
jgi:AraC family transcriptional activator of pobA